ncbi:hypothetical protein [Argonema antarcticum]|nr:hypothetical protein [Argonema antarcticum]MCL1470350.1 hypothetical protein [Argonema antarcticum A004/B2]
MFVAIVTAYIGVEAYLPQRQQQAQEVRQINQARFDQQGLRDRLLARKAE